MVNWKTTLGGILIAIGGFLQTMHEPAWVPILASVLIGVGGLIAGTQARDKNVSSERSGAK